MENEIVTSLKQWIEEQQPTTPTYEIYKALVDGTVSYREYLKLLGKLVNYFCTDLGFVPDSNLVRIIRDKFQTECSGDVLSSSVQRIMGGIPTLPSFEDDFI